MPSEERSVRMGYHSDYISGRTARILISLSNTQSAIRTAENMDTTLGNVRAWVRHVENKLHARLFERKPGRSHSTWVPIYRPLNNSHWRKLRNLAIT